MMNYELFKEVVASRIKEFLPPSYAEHKIVVEPRCKMNRTVDCMYALSAEKEEVKVCPEICLNDEYDRFKVSQDMDELLKFMASIIVTHSASFDNDSVDFGFKSKTDKLVMNIINTEKNKEFLQKVPHKDILDFSIVYRFIMEQTNTRISTVLLTNGLLEEIGLTENELHSLAMKNTEKLLPIKIFTRQDVIPDDPKDIEACKIAESGYSDIYTVTNNAYLHGAAYLASGEQLKKLAARMKMGYYVIPGSVNEFYAIPENIGYPKMLKAMLRDGNAHLINEGEFLSDNIYYYNKGKHRLMIV